MNNDDVSAYRNVGGLLGETVKKVNTSLYKGISHALLASANEAQTGSQVELILFSILDGLIAERIRSGSIQEDKS